MIIYECNYCGSERTYHGKCPNCFSKKRPSKKITKDIKGELC